MDVSGDQTSCYNVLNLSACTLSKGELSLLSKGLNYVPANNMDVFQTCKDVNKFIRDLTVKKDFVIGQQEDHTVSPS